MNHLLLFNLTCLLDEDETIVRDQPYSFDSHPKHSARHKNAKCVFVEMEGSPSMIGQEYACHLDVHTSKNRVLTVSQNFVFGSDHTKTKVVEGGNVTQVNEAFAPTTVVDATKPRAIKIAQRDGAGEETRSSRGVQTKERPRKGNQDRKVNKTG